MAVPAREFASKQQASGEVPSRVIPLEVSVQLRQADDSSQRSSKICLNFRIVPLS
jgi:hypothetical protein